MARIRMMPPFILPLLQNLHLPGQPRPFEQLTDSVCQKAGGLKDLLRPFNESLMNMWP